MKTFLLCAVLATVTAGCASETETARYYDNNDIELAVGNGALMMCSCVFVMEMPEDHCRAWVRASPNVARLSVDTTAKTVESSAFITWAAKAHWVDEKRGCVLE
ncbi:MAG: hypothetical protein K1X64_16525 [Myxococcaceae bacterium]|nr:hypothetical protein [Myxococcaceae bacterium]